MRPKFIQSTDLGYISFRESQVNKKKVIYVNFFVKKNN